MTVKFMPPTRSSHGFLFIVTVNTFSSAVPGASSLASCELISAMAAIPDTDTESDVTRSTLVTKSGRFVSHPDSQ